MLGTSVIECFTHIIFIFIQIVWAEYYNSHFLMKSYQVIISSDLYIYNHYNQYSVVAAIAFFQISSQVRCGVGF